MNKNYTFSSRTVAEFYGRRFYAILKGSEVVAYSEKKFDIPEDVIFYGGRNTIIFEKAVIRGGEIWGGVIWGGVIRGGEIRGGVYKISMLQIQGTRHFCYARYSERGDKIELGIGCIVKPLNEWIECYENIGVKESYSKEEISEYGMYIRLFAQRYEPELLT